MIDWSAIRSAYESGGSSLSALEREYSVSRQAIKKRATKEKWVTPQLQVTVTGNNQGVINRDVNAAVRVVDAIPLRQAGWTYDRIAAKCGYGSPGAARNAVQRELDRRIAQNIDEWRKDHISRLEKQHETIWPLAIPNDTKGKINLFAHDRLLAISEREAKLLGLDVRQDGEQNTAQVVVVEIPEGL